MTWNKWHRLSVVYRFLDELERDFPAICTVCVIGKSVEGRDIKVTYNISHITSWKSVNKINIVDYSQKKSILSAEILLFSVHMLFLKFNKVGETTTYDRFCYKYNISDRYLSYLILYWIKSYEVIRCNVTIKLTDV